MKKVNSALFRPRVLILLLRYRRYLGHFYLFLSSYSVFFYIYKFYSDIVFLEGNFYCVRKELFALFPFLSFLC